LLQIKNSVHGDFLALIKGPIYPRKFRDQLKNFLTSHRKFSDTNYNRDSKKIAISKQYRTAELHIIKWTKKTK
jgi:hypothetical protein